MLLHGNRHRCSRLDLCLLQLRFHLSAHRSFRLRHRLRLLALALCARSFRLLATSFAAAAASGASGASDTGATITVVSARGCHFPCFQASVASFDAAKLVNWY
jgi:hypothetical protein